MMQHMYILVIELCCCLHVMLKVMHEAKLEVMLEVMLKVMFEASNTHRVLIKHESIMEL